MHLVFDARLADPARHGGVGRFAAALWPRLAVHVDRMSLLVPAQPSPGVSDPVRGAGVPPGAEPWFEREASPPFGLTEQWAIPAAARRLRGDVLFVPAFNAPLWQPVPTAVAIHDLIHLRFRAHYGAAKHLYYQAVVGPAARRAAAVVTVSEFSRREIVDLLRVPAERIHVISNGVDPLFFQSVGGQRAERRIGSVAPYVMSVVNPKPHKNAERIVQAFARVLSQGASARLRLVLVGDPGTPARRAATRSGVTERIDMLSRVSDRDMAQLYRDASLLFFPSLYEGFGLPVLEAMASGTPVVTSRVSALPEIADQAALYVDPRDVDDMARSIVRVLHDSSLNQYLRRAGPARARGFEWDSAARSLGRVLVGLTGRA